ncbi:hypothetical protein [Chamaesiphon minutus]|uniref:Uncharacterized protein n=1 Tax=Chamaesiphon minutus (strain ATCC 27169 / PCC 6605) TaxID=1173020 RepID=K9UBT2_CHAP6|nr:hypothetical protein [Chamaesiphon minutus]AFY91679.1 hypothetical protein Cha6605_0381 [Chamaesiphon minutus PCC 6605]
MKHLNLIFEEFQNFGSRVAFDLHNGEHHEGYIYDIESDYLIFSEGGPLASGEDIEIRLADIDLTTLAYFDDRARCYMDAVWHNVLACWQFRPSD